MKQINLVRNLKKIDIEWFSSECRKTKTEVITPANHKGRKQDPIKTQVITCICYMRMSPSAGKRVLASQDWLWFNF